MFLQSSLHCNVFLSSFEFDNTPVRTKRRPFDHFDARSNRKTDDIHRLESLYNLHCFKMVCHEKCNLLQKRTVAN